jgi:hypothetical protein
MNDLWLESEWAYQDDNKLHCNELILMMSKYKSKEYNWNTFRMCIIIDQDKSMAYNWATCNMCLGIFQDKSNK